MNHPRSIKTAAVVGLVCALALAWCWRIASAASEFDLPDGYELPFGSNPFAPSNAKTSTGRLIAQSEFIPAARCAKCHGETHAEWSESAHRNSFREPFYQANVEHLIRDRDITVTRHCESCHNPAALFSGSLTKGAKAERPFDDEGVTCSVCHAVQSVTTEGIGSYTMAPPALLEFEDGRRVRDASDQEVLNNLEAHSRAVMRPLLKQPEFCAACHKSAIVPELNGRKWFRTFSVYDEWQQSSFAGETVQPLGAKPYQSCQSCHMPKQAEALGYASHRWAGGNTAIAAHYGWGEQVKAVSDLLKSGVVTVDLFALRQTADAATAPLGGDAVAAAASVAPGRKISVDVVVANKGVGHAFPAELRDMFEAWVEFEARDASGRVLTHSGAVSPDGTLEWSAHAYRNVPIDNAGQNITRHDIWNTRVGGIDRFIPAGRADLARFSFDVPPDAKAPIKLTAKLNYRRFNSRFVEWVAQSHPVAQSPVVEMSSASVSLRIAGGRAESAAVGKNAHADSKKAELRKRWRFYGVALFDQQQFEEAARAFEQARALAEPNSPDEAASCVDLALTYMRMERAGSSRATLAKADECIARALELVPADGRARFYHALLSVKQFRYTEALADLESLSHERPRDRQVWTQLASVYLLQRRDREARKAYEHLLTIDPDDTEANFKLAGLYWRFQLPDMAKAAQDKYQARHTDTVGETLRRDFLRRRPELYFTWPWREFGDNPIGSTP